MATERPKKSQLQPRPELLETTPQKKRVKAYLKALSTYITPKSIVLVETAINEFQKVVRKPLEKITEDDILRFFKAKKKEERKNSTIQLYWIHVRAYIRYYMPDSPILKVRSPVVKKRVVDRIAKAIVTEKELQKVLKHCPTPRDRAMFVVLFYTGMRVSELVALDWSDIDFEKPAILVKRRKTESESWVPLTKQVLASLIELRNNTPPDQEFLFPAWRRNAYGERLTKAGAYTIIRRIGKKAGLRDEQRHPHAFRHSSAVYYRQKGLKLTEIQKLLGHSTWTMTASYDFVTESDLAEAMFRATGEKPKVRVVREIEQCPMCGEERLGEWQRVCICGHIFGGDKDSRIKELEKRIETLHSLVEKMTPTYTVKTKKKAIGKS